jgi:hypothetical protein
MPAPGFPFWSRLYWGDSREVLGEIERPDLIVTDPPRGTGKGAHGKHGPMAGDEDMLTGYAVLALAIQKLKPGGLIYCFADAMRPFDLKQAGGRLIEVLPPLALDKQGRAPGGGSRGPCWEYISVGQRLPDAQDPDDMEILRALCERGRGELGGMLWPRPDDAEGHALRGIDGPPLSSPIDSTGAEAILAYQRPRRFRRGAILRYPRRDTERHPTDERSDLLKELIGLSSRIYDLVLDPFAGSGSTGVAALELGRRFIGIELEEGLARRAAERMVAAKCEAMEAALAEEARWLRTRAGWEWWETLGERTEWGERIDP